MDTTASLPPLDAATDNVPHDKAPKDRRVGPRGARAAAVQAEVTDGLSGIYVMLGMLVYTRNHYDGQLIIEKSRDMAETLEAVCRKDKRVYRILIMLAKGTDWTKLTLVYGGVFCAIAANHNAVPNAWPELFGIQPPPERPERAEQSMPETPINVGPSEATAQSSSEAPGPGLHVSAHQLELLQEQAIREALELQRRAQANGADGMPAPETNPAGRIGYQ